MSPVTSSDEPSLFARRLGHDFFARDARLAARALIGTYLVLAREGAGPKVARIVETEAYCGPKDLASHARAGLTKRTRILLGPPGHAYVYFIYGMYDCFNIVCGQEGRGHAVLVRGVEPVAGFPEGARADGPGRLTRAFGITREDNGRDLTERPLYLLPRDRRPRIAVTARVGVAYAGEIAEAPWRFLDATSAHVSRPPRKSIGLGLSAGGVRRRDG